MKFRKSIKVAKGVRINIGKKGVASVSVGGKGTTLNISDKGVKATASIPGTGLSHSETIIKPSTTAAQAKSIDPSANTSHRPVSLLLGLGIFVMPYIFVWFLLRKGHSTTSRITGFSWLFVMLLSMGSR